MFGNDGSDDEVELDDVGGEWDIRRTSPGRQSFTRLSPPVPAVLPAPLPLMSFALDANDIPKPLTIYGGEIPTIRNTFSESAEAIDAQQHDRETQEKNRLHDPCHARGLSKWFMARSQREILSRQCSEPFSSSSTSPLKASDSASSLESMAGNKSEPLPLYDVAMYERSIGRKPTKNSRPACTCRPLIPGDTSEDEEGVGTAAAAAAATTPTIPPSSQCVACALDNSLAFDSNFECGNLDRVFRVHNRHTLMNSTRALEFLQQYTAPAEVDQEYDLTLQKDVYTNGNIQWYYFSATSPKNTAGGCSVKYPLKVRFQITNFQKSDALYNYGMKPAVLSMHRESLGWQRGGTDICYFKNGLTAVRSTYASSSASDEADKKAAAPKKKLRQFFSLVFTYTFEHAGETVFFAHSFPYTYSDLQSYLLSLQMDERISQFCRRKLLCNTLAGNRCDVLTITARSKELDDASDKPAIVVSARVHPGETFSSLAAHGFIEYIVADTPEARALRDHFVFKIVPMLNPDGVIHGNYRCSLAGTDLNRRYNDMYPYLYPTVLAMRGLLDSVQQKRGVLLYLDLHCHSKNKNAFVYGCDVLQMPEKQLRAVLPTMNASKIATQRVFSRLFPRLLCTVSDAHAGFELPQGGEGSPGRAAKGFLTVDKDSKKYAKELEGEEKKERGYFSFADCTFTVSKSKFGTGRVVSWRQLEIEGSYTIEISFCSRGDNRERSLLKKLLDGKLLRSASSPAGGEGGAWERIDRLYAFCKANSDSLPGVSASDLALLKKLADMYALDKHFTKDDMQRLGRDIGDAVLQFTNLQFFVEKEKNGNADEPSTPRASISKPKTAARPDVADSKPPWQSASPEAERRRREANATSPSSSGQASTSLMVTGPPTPPIQRPVEVRSLASEDAYDASMLTAPLPQPWLFSGAAFSHALNTHPAEFRSQRIVSTDHVGVRFKCEQEIRKNLALEFTFRPAPTAGFSSSSSSSSSSSFSTSSSSSSSSTPTKGDGGHGPDEAAEAIFCVAHESFSVNLDSQVDSADEGSESDPSVDNVPVSRLTRDMGALKSPDALIAALRSAEGKRRAKEEKAEREVAKEAEARRMANRQLQLQAQEEALRKAKNAKKASAAADKKRATYSMTTLKRVSAKNMAPPHIPVYKLADSRGKPPMLMHISTLDGSITTSRSPEPKVMRPASAQSFLTTGVQDDMMAAAPHPSSPQQASLFDAAISLYSRVPVERPSAAAPGGSMLTASIPGRKSPPTLKVPPSPPSPFNDK